MAAGKFLATTSNDCSLGHRPLGIGIALGSNLGDRLENLRRARALICALPDVELETCESAPVFETEPIGCEPGAAWFLNTVIELQNHLPVEPDRLLAELHEIETILGRTRASARNRSRTIDLDLLYVGDCRLHSATLTLPHPRLDQRRFVLAPLATLRPASVLPGLKAPVGELLASLPDDPATVRKFIEVW
jgi:2-amino-4-hydroxy-6-hydroxymethyldihydropteridine diphosphokinase